VSEDFAPHSRETHSTHCAQLNGPLHEYISTTYGVTRDSILNTSKFFHVTEGLAPDIMHDVLEGCLQYEVKELLKYLILNVKVISLSVLNGRIDSFSYGYIDSPNKPVPISVNSLNSSDHGLKQTGMLIDLINDV
jgi:hypothetical protein